MATIFSQALDANDAWGAVSLRNVVKISAGALDQVRVTFEASSAASYIITNASIAISNTTDIESSELALCVCSATPTSLLFGGVANKTITAGNQFTSDWVNFNGFTSSNFLVVTVDSSQGSIRLKSGLGTFNAAGTAVYAYEFSGARYNQAANTGYTAGGNGTVEGLFSIETQSVVTTAKRRLFLLSGVG